MVCPDRYDYPASRRLNLPLMMLGRVEVSGNRRSQKRIREPQFSLRLRRPILEHANWMSVQPSA